jgi:hypothetical protein
VAQSGRSFEEVDAWTLEDVAGMRKAWEHTPPLPVSACRMLMYFGLHQPPEQPADRIPEALMASMREKLMENMRNDAALGANDQIMEVLGERKQPVD